MLPLAALTLMILQV